MGGKEISVRGHCGARWNSALKSMTGAVLVFFAATFSGGVVRADPPATAARVQLALVEPAQWLDEDQSVEGLRLSLIRGTNRDVSGLDLSGVATRTLGSLRGLQIAPANDVERDGTGVQIALFTSYVEGGFRGLQLSGLGARAGQGAGGQLAAVLSDAPMWKGFQISLATRAGEMKGLQFGLLNRARELEGLQIGLLNFNERGFLPVFPLFNFGL
jgi:hypothetical protein